MQLGRHREVRPALKLYSGRLLSGIHEGSQYGYSGLWPSILVPPLGLRYFSNDELAQRLEADVRQ